MFFRQGQPRMAGEGGSTNLKASNLSAQIHAEHILHIAPTAHSLEGEGEAHGVEDLMSGRAPCDSVSRGEGVSPAP